MNPELWWENLQESDYFEDLGIIVDARMMMLKMMRKKSVGRT
jgi:hypothetical protein